MKHCHTPLQVPETGRGIRRFGLGALSLTLALVLGWGGEAEAWWFHATRRAAARSIMKNGINPGKMKNGSRFGAGFYLSRRAAGAQAEKRAAGSVVRFKGGRSLEKNAVDLRRPTPAGIKSRLGNLDLRGAMKKWVIGPKLGKKLGRWATQKGKALQYRSVKTGGSNLVIPKTVIREHPGLINPDKIVPH